jgi:DNA-directed RNA polymerase sigma subunit (sigma70/sigma32)
MSKKGNFPSDRDFQELAIKVNNTLIQNDGLIGDQKQQVELLFSLENKFKNSIQRYQQTHDIYIKFINHIVNNNGNILSARPYFREKADVFSSKITEAIKEKDARSLMKCDINFQFIDFIVKNWKGKLPERTRGYYKDFLEARRILIENNLPLAINRAKLFYRKTPRSHLTLLDLIDICTHGLISGVDKYVGEYTKVWRSVCIGRMVGYMIDEYSKTFLRMYPTDKKILYRANALKYRLKIEDVVELTKAVNESFQKDKEEGKNTPKLPISEIHIRTLLNGSSYTSANTKTGDNNEGLTIYDYSPDLGPSVEDMAIKKDLIDKVSSALQELSIIEKKIIKLKGVNI